MIKYGTTTVQDDRKRRMALTLLAEQGNAAGSDKAASRYGRLAEAYASAGSSAEPVGHWMQAVARAAQGAVGGLYGDLARKEDLAAEQNASAAGLAKEGRDHDRAMELARAKSLLEQEDPAYQANLAKTKAETDELSAKSKYRSSLMRMLNGEEGTEAPPPEAAANTVGGKPPEVNVPVPPSGAPAPSAPLPVPSQQPMPGVQPQSFDGLGMQPTPAVGPPPGAPGGGIDPAVRRRMAETIAGAAPQTLAPSQQTMPGIQFVADQGAPVGAAPMQPQQGPGAAGPDMIDTPFGRMTREKARRMGGALMMDPQYATAGKALFDQATAPIDSALAKPTVNAIQEKQLNATESWSRLRAIEQSFKPEYQEIETRIGNKWNELVDSFSSTRKSLTPEQTTQLAEFSAYRAEALNNLNQYVKEITGAAMTNAEADRIMKAMPNPGDGVFNGDSPTVFKAKLDAAMRSSKMALARYQYLSKNGFSGGVEDMAKALPLERMGAVIQGRTNELLKETLSQNPGLTQQDVLPLVRQRLRAEFGIDA